jgi:hypothetical protein
VIAVLVRDENAVETDQSRRRAVWQGAVMIADFHPSIASRQIRGAQ